MKSIVIILSLSISTLASSCYVAASADQWDKGTGQLQAKVLTKINQGLSRGSISPQQATALKEELNTISEHETIYESYGLPTPQTAVQKDFDDLNMLGAEVDRTVALKPDSTNGSVNVMHRDIHKLISNALTSNKITNAQAEDYYSRLAEIENDMESLKSDAANSDSEILALNKNLQELKTDVQKHTAGSLAFQTH